MRYFRDYYLLFTLWLCNFHYLIIASQCPCIFPGFQSVSNKSTVHTERRNESKPFQLFLHPQEKLHICMNDETYHELHYIDSMYLKEAENQNLMAPTHSKRHKVRMTGIVQSIFDAKNPLLQIHSVPSSSDLTSASNCHVVLTIASLPLETLAMKRRLCPDSCLPLPSLELPKSFLLPTYLNIKQDYAVTCSMTFQKDLMIKFHRFRKEYPTQGWLAFLLLETGHRRYFECHETAALYRYAFPRNLHAFINDTHHYLSESFHFNHSKRATAGGHYPHSNRFHRRQIRGMIVWIGSTARYSLIEEQAAVLSEAAFHTPNAVIGWAATDDLYPCPANSIKCYSNNKKYQGLVPATNINFMPAGWGCAQRRPLRAMSHLLLFFMMDFLAVVDDDTFFNYALFAKKYLHNYFSVHSFSSHSTALQKTMYYGEALGATGDRGHLSKEGFFVGGSGYLFNRRVLERLVKKEIIYYGYESLLFSDDMRIPSQRPEHLRSVEDPYRSEFQWQKLSLLQEGLDYSRQSCVLHSPLKSSDSIRDNPKYACIYPMELRKTREKSLLNYLAQETDLSDQFARVPLSLRLVDFCSNLMANENTCQHSDHSLGRCLLYGVGATPVNVPCHVESSGKSTEGETNSSIPLVGMCFMSPRCDLAEQLTCHRYQAKRVPNSREIVAEKITPQGSGNYRKYSSVFNGERIESKL